MTTLDPLPSYGDRTPKLIGGLPCLDFVNTVEWRGDPTAWGEHLINYGELIHWAGAAGLVARREAKRLLSAAKRDPDAAQTVLKEAVDLRETLARLLRSPDLPEESDLARVNRLLAQAPARGVLSAADGGFAWAGGGESLWRPLWPVLWSAADLLTSERLGQVRACSDPRCGWLFLDTSRNRSRRWCAMADCGNRAKARRHYARRLEQKGP
ncbi:MAG: ABATE domain-containing protein [Pseudomonadota bacterium]